MPPQQGDRLLDLVDEDLDFLTHSLTACYPVPDGRGT
jgi:hypothetical protein